MQQGIHLVHRGHQHVAGAMVLKVQHGVIERDQRSCFALGDGEIGSERFELQGDLGGRRVGHRFGEKRGRGRGG